MTIGLRELIAQQQQLQTGTSVVQGEGVSITPSEAGEEVKLNTSTGDTVVTIGDDASMQIGTGESVTSITDTLSDSNPDNDNLLVTAAGIASYVQSFTAGTTIEEVYGIGTFNTFLTQPTISPSLIIVTDSTPFDFTDSGSNAKTDLTWMQVFVERESGQAAHTTILSTSSDSSSLTASEADALILSLSDREAFTTARAATVDTIEATVTTGLDGKVDKLTDHVLSKNNFTDAYKDALDNVPANTNQLLADKLDVDSSGVNVVINNPGNGTGQLTIRNSSAPANQKDFVLLSRSDGTFDFEARNDDGSLQNRWEYQHDGVSKFPGQIKQENNDVVDVTYSKLVNLPLDTNAALADKVDVSGSKVLSDLNFSQDDKDQLESLAAGTFDGGISAGGDIAAAGSIAGDEYYMTSGASTDWGVSISSAGAGNGLGGTTAGAAESFTGDAYRVRVDSDTNSGYMIENSIGYPLFELNSSSGQSFFRGRVKNTTNGWGFLHESLDGVSGGIQATGNQLLIGSESDHKVGITVGGNAPALTVSSDDIVRTTSDLYVGRRAYINEYIEFRDDDDNRLRIDTAAAGFNIRAVDNPADGEPIQSVYSASGSRRLGIEHNGAITTSNDEIRVDTFGDGTGGHVVIHEGNRQLATQSNVFIDTANTDFALSGGLTTQHMLDAKGGELLLISVGIQSATLPQITVAGGSNSFKTGESFKLCNFNETSDININTPEGHQQAIGYPLNTNTGTVTIPAGTTVLFTAVDGRSYGTWGKRTWVARELVN